MYAPPFSFLDETTGGRVILTDSELAEELGQGGLAAPSAALARAARAVRVFRANAYTIKRTLDADAVTLSPPPPPPSLPY